MQTKRTPVELNEPARPEPSEELREYLLSASNGLYLYELVSAREGCTVPESLKRAHSAVRAELKRMEAARAARTSRSQDE
jgi:hypothetical protein